MKNILSPILCSALAASILFGQEPGDERPVISDQTRKASVEAQYRRQRNLAENRVFELFGVMDGARGSQLSMAEREALTFLYAYMPLQDMADYDGDFFLRAVRATLAARSEMPWGEEIPEDLFLSFVLPLRVNTENLDEARPELYKALKDRVRGLSLEKAILEVNHWCREMVTYRSSDGRTSAPLSTIRTSWGRCGEESVLTVAALRSVGIPARQVYTPRWAHVDDNHAWVEAWVGGEWHYMGACEPEPKLDMAWFTEPARRAMMVHTKVYGGSNSDDFIINSSRYFDEIQLLPAYAPTIERRVRVVDPSGRPVQGALVEFGLYNYAEFYPLASPLTNAQGRASLPTGKGDLRIWASKGDLAGSGLLKGDDEEEIVIKLAPFKAEDRLELLDIRPPSEPMPEAPAVSREAVVANRQRVAKEDQIRESYMATFATEAQSRRLAVEFGLYNSDLWPMLQKSQGNHQEIIKFLKGARQDAVVEAMALLASISEKDLRDTPASVLNDHFSIVTDEMLDESEELSPVEYRRFIDYVLCPRIHNELLSPWRSGLREFFGEAELASYKRNPSLAADWVRDNIKIDRESNYYSVPMRPMGAAKLRLADPLGRDILFVAICRTAGIPARLEPGTLAPQFFQSGWKTVNWGGQPVAIATSTVTITGRLDTKPAYLSHFALARYKGGRWQTLDYEDRPWEYFEAGLALDPGYYCLTTGNRQDDGSVLVRLAYFGLKANENRVLPLVMRPSRPAPNPLGKVGLNAALPSIPLIKSGSNWKEGQPLALNRLSGGKGLIIAWLGDGDEPTRHAMGDLEQLREPIEKWGGGLALCVQALPKGAAKHLDKIRDMAQQAQLLLDGNGQLLAQVLDAIKRQPTDQLPIIMGISKTGDVIYYSEGYRIGVGEQVLRAIRRLEKN